MQIIQLVDIVISKYSVILSCVYLYVSGSFMMTFKEINDRIYHYEDELKHCHQVILELNNVISKENSTAIINSVKIQKTKIEFFCFVTTSYIDLLCTYRNIKRAKSNWEKYFSVKIAYLIAYETINTYYKYKGEIYKAVKKKEKDFYENFFDMLNRELTVSSPFFRANQK